MKETKQYESINKFHYNHSFSVKNPQQHYQLNYHLHWLSHKWQHKFSWECQKIHHDMKKVLCSLPFNSGSLKYNIPIVKLQRSISHKTNSTIPSSQLWWSISLMIQIRETFPTSMYHVTNTLYFEFQTDMKLFLHI